MFNTLQYFEQFYLEYAWLIAIVSVWSLAWKGYALWKAAHLNNRNWFIALLIINTLGILEILYIFIFSKKAKSVQPVQTSTAAAPTPGNINIDEFQKSQLRVGKIKSAEKVPGSDKLLKLKVDLGSEERQIIAGIGSAYSPESLMNEEVVIVTNLEPRKLMGLESQGMLLAASDGKPVILIPKQPVALGSKIQ